MVDADRPLLFLDVDGPLIPFGDPPPGGYPRYRSPYVRPGAAMGGNPLITRVDPELGPRLLSLRCRPVWATTWLEDANECLAPWLGLPRLPVVDWPVDDTDDANAMEAVNTMEAMQATDTKDRPDITNRPDEPDRVHWKTRTLVAWANGRPFAWVDDEITEPDRRWVAAHSPARALLHRVDPRRGLTEADFTALDAWLGGGLSGRRPTDPPHRQPIRTAAPPTDPPIDRPHPHGTSTPPAHPPPARQHDCPAAPVGATGQSAIRVRNPRAGPAAGRRCRRPGPGRYGD